MVVNIIFLSFLLFSMCKSIHDAVNTWINCSFLYLLLLSLLCMVIQDAGAMYFLGICHERGMGTPRNEARAAELYRSASSHGHVDALYNLAVFFENGIGGILYHHVHCVFSFTGNHDLVVKVVIWLI